MNTTTDENGLVGSKSQTIKYVIGMNNVNMEEFASDALQEGVCSICL